MQLGIIGLSQSGKATLFEAVTRSEHEKSKKGEQQIGTIDVPDPRVDKLSAMYKPKKTIHAKIQYVYAPRDTYGGGQPGEALLKQVRNCDALIHVVRNFQEPGMDPVQPAQDFSELDQELILADLAIVEKRLERITADARRGNKPEDPDEPGVLEKCKAMLEAETPLRRDMELARAHCLRGYMLVSAKPMLVVFNNADDNDQPPAADPVWELDPCMVMRCRLEQELAQMDPEDAVEFLAEYGVAEPAMSRMIRKSYEMLGLISFFTVGEDEVRALTIEEGMNAQEAAGAIHTDLSRGFIRAEVVGYHDLVEAGSIAEAKKAGTFSLEGKTYAVKDGDIMHVRFNV